MTAKNLKKKLLEVCRKNREILDVIFYQKDKKKLIVVVYIDKYKGLSSNLDSFNFRSIEAAVLFFIDEDQLTAMDMDEGNERESVNAKLDFNR